MHCGEWHRLVAGENLVNGRTSSQQRIDAPKLVPAALLRPTLNVASEHDPIPHTLVAKTRPDADAPVRERDRFDAAGHGTTSRPCLGRRPRYVGHQRTRWALRSTPSVSGVAFGEDQRSY
ncbi:MAG: hypothetical protein ABR992_06650 [Solirubrobacteraceae bacterium]